MPRPRKLEAPNAEDTFVEGDAVLEEFEQPVPVVKPGDKVPDGMAMVRVLPKGAGVVATGHYDKASNAFTYYDKGEHAVIPKAIAKIQEDNGLVEIVDGV